MDLLSKEVSEILRDNKIQKLTKIQEISLPLTLNNKNTIIVSKTGSGKTFTFLLPIISKLMKKGTEFKKFALIVAPTKDLASQIYDNLQMFNKLGLRSVLCIDSDSKLSDEHIIVGTPGSIRSLLKDLKTIKFLVFDEVDKLLSKNYEREVVKILDYFGISYQNKENAHTIKKLQVILSTATFNKDHIMDYLDISDFKIAQIDLENDKITQYYAFVPLCEKYLHFYQIVSSLPKCIIFVSRIFNTYLISNFLKELELEVCFVNGLLFQEEKNQVIRDFKEGRFNILICTDILARGIDIPEVENIVNFDMPKNGKEYVHRIGRTARKNLSGNSITMVTQYDIETIQRIEHFTKVKMQKYNLPEKLSEKEKVEQAYEKALKQSKIDMKNDEAKRKNQKNK
ncbi:ATP-dependent RNA helicase [Pseudoloma neurophilia]|uniref:ATP-dependent RNA helicase n=1 Tax=Pseudoloma neurophilia TaxID=146866 RepID=A0A0R0LZT9_9MICR|nr:ATP-dependent RNA helicase [Pseudoloma neurophilia]